jgi:hypothetical protein
MGKLYIYRPEEVFWDGKDWRMSACTPDEVLSWPSEKQGPIDVIVWWDGSDWQTRTGIAAGCDAQLLE